MKALQLAKLPCKLPYILFIILAASTIVLLNAPSSYAADYSYQLNSTQLPFLTTEYVTASGIENDTLTMGYDNYLAGPTTASILGGSATIPVNVTVPNGTMPGTYSSLLTVNGTNSSITKTFFFNITNTSSIPPAPEPPFFSIGTDKSSYSIGDTAYIIVNATANATVNLTVCPNQTGWVQCYPQINLPAQQYPAQVILPYTTKAEPFTIDGVFKKGNTTLTAKAGYSVQNSIVTQIGGHSAPDIGEKTTLTAAAAGGIAPYTYKWTLANGTVISGDSATVMYNSEGTYTETVFVKDANNNNATTGIDVLVRLKYPITIIVQDNDTGARIESAEVTVDNEEIDTFTDSNGEASFSMYRGNYRFLARKSGYSQYYKSNIINDTTSFTIYLKPIASSQLPTSGSSQNTQPAGNSLNIQPITSDGTKFNNDSVNLEFKVAGSNAASCTVMLSDNGDAWYRTIRTFGNVQKDQIYSAGVTNLADSKYTWRVDCIDLQKKQSSSDIYSFIVNSSLTTIELDAGTGPITLSGNDADFAAAVQAAQDKIASLPFEAKNIAEALHLQEILQDSIKQVEWGRRDQNAVGFRTDLDDAAKERERAAVEEEISNIKKNTPLSVTVLDSRKYVKYIRDNELETFLQAYDALPPERKTPGPSLSHSRLFDGNKLLQQEITVSTTAYSIEFETASGEKQPYTVLIKQIQLGQNINMTSKKVLVEYVPKEVSLTAQNASKFIYGSQYTILEEDPLIEFNLQDSAIIYAIPGQIDLDKTKDINTVLYDPAPPAAENGITGSVIGQFEALGPLAYLIVLVGILILVYVVYILNLPSHIYGIWLKIFKDKQIQYIKVMVNDAQDYLDANDLDNAELIYREIKLVYEKMKAHSKEEVYNPAIELCAKLDENYLDIVLDKFNSYLKTGNTEKAEVAAEKIFGTYAKLLPQYQKEMHSAVVDALKRVKPDIQIPAPGNNPGPDTATIPRENIIGGAS